MRVSSRLHHQGLIGRNKKFVPIYLAGLLAALQYYLVIYVNSSYLQNFFSNFQIAILFALSSILSIASLLSAEVFLKKTSLKNLFVLTALLEIFAVGTLVMADNSLFIGLAFILYGGAVGFLFYILDVMLEREMRSESTTGEVRGIFLTVANVALVFSPVLAGFIIGDGDYRGLYLISLIALLFAVPIHFSKRAGSHVTPDPHSPIQKTLRLGIALNFLLQFFYAWMVVWTPIYLHQELGFSWPQIGIIFSIMVLPFALFELPLGELADRQFSEREIMAIGFLLAGGATAVLALLGSQSFVGWALALFMTRTGAAAVEISTEAYFFKHVKGSETGTVGLFRTMRPLSFLIAPLVGALAIYLLGFGPSYVVLAFILFVGAFLSLRLKDIQ